MIFPVRHKQHRPGEMNKTELAYSQRLQVLKYAGEILDFKFECIKLNLAARTFYTPDFLVIYPDHFEIHEVKGWWEEDARVKIKVAAETFPWFFFRGVKLIKREWVYEDF